MDHPTNWMEIDRDGKFQVLDVAEGDYWIDVDFSGAGPLPPAFAIAFHMPAIPGGVGDEPLVIADIAVKAK